jgi:hypothetical protein
MHSFLFKQGPDLLPNRTSLKLYGENTSYTQNDFKTEWNKAAGDNDYFFLFTTKSDLDWIELPHHCGIVSGDNWDNYFGPFAGRAYRYKSLEGGKRKQEQQQQQESIDINMATSVQEDLSQVTTFHCQVLPI